MPPVADDPTRADLERLRRRIAAVLGALALLALVATFTGLWPVATVDRLALAWLGRASLRARVVGVFCSYGLILLALLLPALLVKTLLRRRAR